MRQWLASVMGVLAIVSALAASGASREEFLTIALASWLVPEAYRRLAELVRGWLRR